MKNLQDRIMFFFLFNKRKKTNEYFISHMQQTTNLVFSVLALLLVSYTVRNNMSSSDDRSVSICHVYARYNLAEQFDDRRLLSLLSKFKMLDFHIGQPILSSNNGLLYLCEHRLKTGIKQTILDNELNDIMQTNTIIFKHLSWTCA